jgi:hypothetical protein
MLFSNLTGDSFTLYGNQQNWSGISGFQIIGIVPEPSTLLLLLAGGLMVANIRRQKGLGH